MWHQGLFPVCPVWIPPSVFQNWLDPSKEIKKQMRSELQGAEMANACACNHKCVKSSFFWQPPALICQICYCNLYNFPPQASQLNPPTLVVIPPQTLPGTLPSLSNSTLRIPPSSPRTSPGGETPFAARRHTHTHSCNVINWIPLGLCCQTLRSINQRRNR